MVDGATRLQKAVTLHKCAATPPAVAARNRAMKRFSVSVPSMSASMWRIDRRASLRWHALTNSTLASSAVRAGSGGPYRWSAALSYPSQVRPVEVHRTQPGFSSPHFTRLILKRFGLADLGTLDRFFCLSLLTCYRGTKSATKDSTARGGKRVAVLTM